MNLHPSKRTRWVAYINEIYFDSYGFGSPQKLSKFTKKRKEHCVYPEYKKQGITNKKNFYCASYCLHIIYLTKIIGTDFKSAVLNLYYQMIQ